MHENDVQLDDVKKKKKCFLVYLSYLGFCVLPFDMMFYNVLIILFLLLICVFAVYFNSFLAPLRGI